jgi:hypothetical protein
MQVKTIFQCFFHAKRCCVELDRLAWIFLRRLRKAFFATLLGGMTFVVRTARIFLSLS